MDKVKAELHFINHKNKLLLYESYAHKEARLSNTQYHKHEADSYLCPEFIHLNFLKPSRLWHPTLKATMQNTLPQNDNSMSKDNKKAKDNKNKKANNNKKAKVNIIPPTTVTANAMTVSIEVKIQEVLVVMVTTIT